MLTYEQQLDRDLSWALLEGSLYFEQQSAVHTSMRRLAQRLEQLVVDYAVAGDLCMFFHGYRRFTEIVEVLVTGEGLTQIDREVVGRDYIRTSDDRLDIRNAQTGVRIKFLISGQYAGGRNGGTAAFPVPRDVSTCIAGVRFVDVAPLIELKFALGQAPHRLRDLADPQELIRYLALPLDFALKLEPRWRPAFHDAWTYAQKAAADDY
jgi:hypothetical protein